MQVNVLEACFEQTTPYLMARVYGPDGLFTGIVAKISSVHLKVYENQSNVLVAETDLAPGDVFFNALQVEPRWTKDDSGYNFAYMVDPSQIPKGAREYHFEFEVKAVGVPQPVGYLVFAQPTLPLHSV